MRATVFIDQTDHAFFPRSGYRAAGSAYRRALGSDSAEQAQDIRRSGSGWLPTGQVSPQPR
jgi:outer membrane protein assembly factor BamA